VQDEEAKPRGPDDPYMTGPEAMQHVDSQQAVTQVVEERFYNENSVKKMIQAAGSIAARLPVIRGERQHHKTQIARGKQEMKTLQGTCLP
jgi:hypothetical protein